MRKLIKRVECSELNISKLFLNCRDRILCCFLYNAYRAVVLHCSHSMYFNKSHRFLNCRLYKTFIKQTECYPTKVVTVSVVGMYVTYVIAGWSNKPAAHPASRAAAPFAKRLPWLSLQLHDMTRGSYLIRLRVVLIKPSLLPYSLNLTHAADIYLANDASYCQTGFANIIASPPTLNLLTLKRPWNTDRGPWRRRWAEI